MLEKQKIFKEESNELEKNNTDNKNENKNNNNNNKTKKSKKRGNLEEKYNIKIGCINVCGLNNNKKQSHVKQFIEKEKWDIAIVNETKLSKNKGKFIYNGWNSHDIINSSYNNENRKSGIAVILKIFIYVK